MHNLLALVIYMKPHPTQYIEQTEANYRKLGYAPYQWFQAEDAPPFTPPMKPLQKSKLGMISTAGTYMQGQVAYHYKDDTSIRKIPRDAPVENIRFSHIMENYLVEARQDPATLFPTEALAQLKKDGTIGDLATNYLSCMGGLYSQTKVKTELIPRLVAAIKAEPIDQLLLVPL